jgi:L-asparaginase/Glu-tRNA(Gln) amidotransferase subunit D
LVEAIKNLVSLNIPVIISSVCIYGKIEPLYETGILFVDAGAISAYDMISEVAMIKLMLILNKTRDMNEIRILMKNSIAKEINIG